MIKAEIVAHSKNNQGDELISVLCTFPRIILAEVNTHRMLSKNTSSSRAIPFGKMVQAIIDNPFIPIAFQADHKGMQGNEYITDDRLTHGSWFRARNNSISEARMLNNNIGVTKQLANRLLEPFMWTTMLITGSKEGWDNFFHLRCPVYEVIEGETFKSWKDLKKSSSSLLQDLSTRHQEDTLFKLQYNKGQAEIHMMALAEVIWDAKNESTPKLLQPGEWHIPFRDKISDNQILNYLNTDGDGPFGNKDYDEVAVQVSTSMGARTSYTIIGEEKEINIESLVSLHDKLISQQPPHSSPMEHCARVMSNEEYDSFIKGKISIHKRMGIANADIHTYNESIKGWCYNHKGFIPYRYLIDNNLTI